MRIKTIDVRGVPPIREFVATDLGDLVVIGGANGAGKSRLVQTVIQRLQQHFHRLGMQQTGGLKLLIEATSEEEAEAWGKRSLDTSVPGDMRTLATFVNRPRSRSNWSGTIINIDSERWFQVSGQAHFSFAAPDPRAEQVSSEQSLNGAVARASDTQLALLRLQHHHQTATANFVTEYRKNSQEPLDVQALPSDPLVPFFELFDRLLAPKKMLKVDPESQTILFKHGDAELNLHALSSGERQVLNIAMDFLMRSPKDSVVFFDEPETHLHPELTLRLIQELRSIGERNQFIFITHSAELINGLMGNDVFFMAPASARGGVGNQAMRVSETDATHDALKLLGGSVGVLTLGRKIVLIEGGGASIDRATYRAILGKKHQDLVLVPSGGREVVESLQRVEREVLSKTLWGVRFFMLCDRDTGIESEETESLKYLKRYSIENYFLESAVWVKALAPLWPEGQRLTQEEIETKLKESARKSVQQAVGLLVAMEVRTRVGNVDVKPRDTGEDGKAEVTSKVQELAAKARARTEAILDPAALSALVESKYALVESSFSGDDWKRVVPGKQVLARFVSSLGAKLPLDRMKHLYLHQALQEPENCFSEVLEIFEGFSCA